MQPKGAFLGELRSRPFLTEQNHVSRREKICRWSTFLLTVPQTHPRDTFPIGLETVSFVGVALFLPGYIKKIVRDIASDFQPI